MWRRIIPLPFEVVIPKEKINRALKDWFKNPEMHGNAIFAWLIEGCRKWLKDGLNPPQKVMDAITNYKMHMSPLGTFIEDACIVAPKDNINSMWIPVSKLVSCYHIWADEHNIPHDLRIKENMLTKRLVERGFSKGKVKDARCIFGLVPNALYLELIQD